MALPASRSISICLMACLLMLAGCGENEAWKKGKELLAANKFPEAAVELQKALDAEKDNPEIMLDLGKALVMNVSGDNAARIEQMIDGARMAGKSAEADALMTELDQRGAEQFAWTQGSDTGLAKFGVRALNNGSASMRDHVIKALLDDPELIKAHYGSIKMDDKAQAFGEAIKLIDASRPQSAQAAIAVWEADKDPLARDNLANILSFMLTSDNAEDVAIADAVLSKPEFDTPGVRQSYKTAFRCKPGSPAATEAGLKGVMRFEPVETLKPLFYQLGGVQSFPDRACEKTSVDRALVVAKALGTEGGKTAMAGPLAGEREKLDLSIAAGVAAAQSASGTEVPAADCQKAWETLKTTASL